MTERDASATSVPAAGFGDFSPTELYDLSEGIADNINTINSGLKALEETMKHIGGPKDSVQLRNKIHDTQQNVNSSVLAVDRDIQRLGAVVRRGDKYYELKVERHTQAFKDALANNETVQRQVFEKLAAHMPRPEQVLKDPQALEQQSIADDEEATLLTKEQAQARVVDFAINMFQEKEAYMNKIKADVLDVNQIIQELPTMVNEQSQAVGSAESHSEARANEWRGVPDEWRAVPVFGMPPLPPLPPDNQGQSNVRICYCCTVSPTVAIFYYVIRIFIVIPLIIFVRLMLKRHA